MAENNNEINTKAAERDFRRSDFYTKIKSIVGTLPIPITIDTIKIVMPKMAAYFSDLSTNQKRAMLAFIAEVYAENPDLLTRLDFLTWLPNDVTIDFFSGIVMDTIKAVGCAIDKSNISGLSDIDYKTVERTITNTFIMVALSIYADAPPSIISDAIYEYIKSKVNEESRICRHDPRFDSKSDSFSPILSNFSPSFG